MLKSALRRTVERLDRSGHRKRMAATANVVAAALRRQQHFSVDEHGDWVRQEAEATFVAPNMLFESYHEKRREVLDTWLHQYVPRAGDTILDIGAGIGDEAVVFSHIVGPSGRVIAIEANPRTFRCLEQTVSRSGLRNIVPCFRAIADDDGVVMINDNPQDHLSNSIVKGDCAGVPVPSSTLDSVLSEMDVGSVALLKMNIEGAETLALEGLVDNARRIEHFVISCHDFLADDGDSPTLRTRDHVLAWCLSKGLQVSQRHEDHRPWVRDYVYARWPRSSATLRSRKQ